MPNEKQMDHLVFIGRFSPFHKGHEFVIKTALELAKHVIVLVGSSNSARKIRNPFTFEERREMILDTFGAKGTNFPGDVMHNLSILPLNDHTYNDEEWVRDVQHIVNEHLRVIHPSNTYEDITKINELKVSLIGHSKDNTSYYLKLFPTWGHIDVHGVYDKNHELINSTKVRDEYFSNITKNTIYNATEIRSAYFSPQWHDMKWVERLPKAVHNILMDWVKTDEYQKIVNTQKYITNYQKQWANSPYPPIFSTVDAVVVQSGHVLLVRRGGEPGLGMLALPGGYLNQDETLLYGALRELREETGLKVPVPVLKGSLKAQKTFDDPNRSDLGRIITTAFLFHLFPQTDLPKVKGGDDAAAAFYIIKNLTAGL